MDENHLNLRGGRWAELPKDTSLEGRVDFLWMATFDPFGEAFLQEFGEADRGLAFECFYELSRSSARYRVWVFEAKYSSH